MANTDQPATFVDLFTLLINSVLQNTSQTATSNQAKGAINRALHDMHVGHDYRYPWAERTAWLVTQPEYTTGTVAVTQGSTTVTGTSTLWNTNNAFSVTNARANGKLRLSGQREVYEVSSVTNDTTIVLKSGYTSATETGASYVYYEDGYDLEADFFKPVDVEKFSQDFPIRLIGRTEFRRRYGGNSVTGRIQVATIQDADFASNVNRVRRVIFAPPPNDFRQIKYHYITSNLAVSSGGAEQTQLSADADEPIIPLRYRHAIVFYALWQWYRDRKDDAQRAGEAKQEYTDLMLRISGDNEIGGARPRIVPAIANYKRKARTPYSGSGSRRYDVNGRFDRLDP